ncbi:hypothetical protein [Thermogymnomonas acidicola]|uniref:hypothetical protein n=1 Tax=Thermogymnomonas acidicola TaxID=399579 RepID=UPI0009467EA6|nr:hypothetical protein [Thermogymnomonas acidicola]
MRLFREVFGLGRTTVQDAETVFRTGAGIAMHLPFDLGHLDRAMEAVRYARSTGRPVAVAVVNVSEWSLERIVEISKRLDSLGVDIIQLPDTLGQATPGRMREVVSAVASSVGGPLWRCTATTTGGLRLPTLWPAWRVAPRGLTAPLWA